MEFREGICPKCNGVLQVPENLEKIICMYCGEEILTEQAVSENQGQQVQLKIDNEELERSIAIGNQKLPELLLSIENPMANFKKEKYESSFKKLYSEFEEVFEAIDYVYRVSEDKEAYITSVAKNFVAIADEDLQKKTSGKKKLVEQKLMDNNFCMAIYVMPSILEYKGVSSEPLVDQLIGEWKLRYPKTNLGKSSFDKIYEGFRWKLCYITTAVCESFSKTDDCYELNLLRDYRDNYLKNEPEGELIIKEYYDVAPTIVKRINKKADSRKIYENIWSRYLSPCIQMIEENKNDECKELYIEMVRNLQKEYTS